MTTSTDVTLFSGTLKQNSNMRTPKINPSIDVQLIFNEGIKTIQCGKGQYFQHILLGKLNVRI